MYIAGVDVGKYVNIGFYLEQETLEHETTNECSFENFLENLQKIMPLAIGFEAPLFVPGKCNKDMTRARHGIDHNRAWTCTSSFQCLFPILNCFFAKLKEKCPQSSVYTSFKEFERSENPNNPNRVFIFESFISGSGTNYTQELCSSENSEHYADARLTAKLEQLNFQGKGETIADFEDFINLPKMFSELYRIKCTTPNEGLILKSSKPVKKNGFWHFSCDDSKQLLLNEGKVISKAASAR